MKNILIVRLSSLGDIILTEPVVRLLKERTQAQVTYLAKQQYLPVLEMIPGIDHSVGLSTSANAAETSRQLRQEPFDEIFDLQRNGRSFAVRRRVPGHVYLARKEWWQRMAAVRCKRLHSQPRHAVERYLNVLRHHGVEPSLLAPRLILPEKYAEWWSEARVDQIDDADYYVIGAGAAHAAKQAPLELWREIDNSIRERYKLRPLLVGAPPEREVLIDLAEELGLPANSVVTESPIGRAGAVIAGARFVISNDSGLAHLAAGLGRPILALFGPTHPILGFEPLGKNADFYSVNEFCSPCSRHGKRPCFREERYCFTKMNATTVLTKLEPLIAG
jgi:heptosyltransferase-2